MERPPLPVIRREAGTEAIKLGMTHHRKIKPSPTLEALVGLIRGSFLSEAAVIYKNFKAATSANANRTNALTTQASTTTASTNTTVRMVTMF